MMLFLKSWITNIAMLVIFVTVVDMLIPDNKYRKYIDLVIGMLVMIAVIKPILGIITFGDRDILKISQIADTKFNYNIDDIQKKQDELIMKVYKENLANQISNYIKNKYGLNVNTVEVSLDDGNSVYAIKNINIKVNDISNQKIRQVQKVILNQTLIDQQNELIQNIRKDISLVYNLPIKNISIVKN